MDAVFLLMIKVNRGIIINISSIVGRFIYDDYLVYNGLKFVVNVII